METNSADMERQDNPDLEIKGDRLKEEEEIDEDDDEMDEEDDEDEEDDVMEELEMIEKGQKRQRDDSSYDPLDKRARLTKQQLRKPPSAEELRTLKETENLFHSNLFRLQIEELLSEVRVKQEYRHLLDKWMVQFEDALENLESLEQCDLMNQKWLKKWKIIVPMKQEPYKLDAKFRFVKPSNVAITGSYAVGLETGPDTVVDVKLEIPAICFRNGDCLNQKYQRKRALYLSFLAAQLQKTDLAEDMKFSFHHGDELKPVLLVKPAGKLGKYILVQILLVPPSNVFKLQKLSPNRNNVKAEWFTGKQTTNNAAETPTPHYNNSLLVDLLMDVNQEYRQQVVGTNQNVRDGIVLLKVWLHQRGLDQGYGGFSSFIMSMYIVYLLQMRRLNKLMSSYQIVRSTWNYLAQSDWTSEGISLAQPADGQPLLEVFHQNFDVVFVDPSGFGNFCANMTKALYYQVKREAEMAMKYLQDTAIDSFTVLFMTPLPFMRTFDQFICFHNITELQKVVNEKAPKSAIVDHCGFTLPVLTPMILNILNRGLRRRVHLIGLELPSIPQWVVTEEPPQYNQLRIGLILNQEFFTSVLEKGPSADHVDAKEFKEFWGEKSELRRFRDISICEAVVWPGNTIAEKREVCVHIMKYILNRHLHIGKENMYCVVNNFESVLNRQNLQGEEAVSAVLKVFDVLGKQLRNCTQLPLNIASLQGISPVFRCTDVFPPQPITKIPGNKSVTPLGKHCILKVDKSAVAPTWIPPLEVLLHMERSSKWPDDIEALQRLKAAFHIRLADVLEKEFLLPAVPNQKYVDVLKDGYVFRLRVVCNKEVSVMKMIHKPEGMIQQKETPESLSLQMETEALSKLTSSLYGLQQLHPSYLPACRLAKRWVSSQLMADYVSDQAVDLLVAYLYVHPEPFSVPCQPQVAFLRFLNLLATTDWKIIPLIVNLNSELEGDEIMKIQDKFSKARLSLPALFIASPFDKTSYWSRNAPTTQMLIRLTHLALEALHVAEGEILLKQNTDPRKTFRPPLDLYDVIIHLFPHQLPLCHLAVDCASETPSKKQQNTIPVTMTEIPVVGYNPVDCYLRDLRDAFDEFALFFYDRYGGKYIGVMWKPHAFRPVEFKVNYVNARKIKDTRTTGKPQLIPNVEAFLEDFHFMGAGLVKNVEAKTDRWVID